MQMYHIIVNKQFLIDDTKKKIKKNYEWIIEWVRKIDSLLADWAMRYA